MNELASKGQLRMSLVRWALVTIPAVLALGLLVGQMSGSGGASPWYQALIKPDNMPLSWVFGIVWTVLYVLIGLAFAIVLNARRASLRTAAILIFLVQLALNYAWPMIFFGRHDVTTALYVLIALDVAVAITLLLFWRIRLSAGLLFLPYLAWVCFATYLNAEIARLNPDAGTLAVPQVRTQI